MTEYEMFMTMINRVYVSDLKNHTYWFDFGEEIDGNIKMFLLKITQTIVFILNLTKREILLIFAERKQ